MCPFEMGVWHWAPGRASTSMSIEIKVDGVVVMHDESSLPCKDRPRLAMYVGDT